MTAQIIDGKHIAAEIRKKLKKRNDNRLISGLTKTGLAVIYLGRDTGLEAESPTWDKG